MNKRVRVKLPNDSLFVNYMGLHWKANVIIYGFPDNNQLCDQSMPLKRHTPQLIKLFVTAPGDLE